MNTRFGRRTRLSRHSGFTLIEVLVAIVVLSFGLLGMVGLQAASLQANRDARLQSAAILLAREMAETMRGNKKVAIQAGNPYLGSFARGALVPTTTSSCLNVGSTACATTSDTARAQLTDWLARVDDQLPGARVTICADAAPFDANGLPQWACTAPTAANAGVVIKIGWTRPAFRRAASDADGGAITSADAAPSVVLAVMAGNSS